MRGGYLIPPVPVADGRRPNLDTLPLQVFQKGGAGRPAVKDGAVRRHLPEIITSCDNGKREMRLAPVVIFTYADAMSVGERIRHYRTQKQRSQTWLAEQIGVSQNTISGWEKGRTEPSRDDVRHIAQALGVDISFLELGDDAPEAHKVRLMGYVGAGQAIELLPGNEPFELVDAPPGAPDGAEAAIVRGGSMYPLLRDGFMLVWWRWSADASAFIGELCVCRLPGDRMLVKIVEPGSRRGRYNLLSLAPGFEPERDCVLEGVAPVEIIYRRLP
jgi:transcriptional regulator with XRE-family HTH domain